MKTVNSLSGGKTSSYIAVHYPADYNIFALVRTDDKNCIYPDAKVRQIVSDKIGKEFIGTLEDDNIINIILDLEQFIGKQITWVSGETYEQIIIERKNYLPNPLVRYCTTELKMYPIFKWWQKNINEIIEMRIGFRKGEEKRANKMKDKLNKKGIESIKAIIGKRGKQNKWGQIEWRKPKFPLIENSIDNLMINKYWNTNKEVRFKKGYYNNCVGCFNRNPLFLNKMAQDHKNKIDWFAEQEKITNNTFRKEFNYKQIINYNTQIELNFDDFSDCDSGYCGL